MSYRWGQPKTDFMEEALRVLEAAKEEKITLRLLGALAFKMRCPNFRYLQDALGRKITDLDFVAYSREKNRILDLFKQLGYEEDVYISAFGGPRLLFHDKASGRHSDIFFDKLEMNHDINFQGRLELDYRTISLVDLLLEKMQIVQINEKDIIDTIMLLREHEIGDQASETVDVGYLKKLCSNDWGLWKTVTTNLSKVRTFLSIYDKLTEEDRQLVNSKADNILNAIKKEPKSFAWKMRAKVGEKKKWYREVEEIFR